MMVHTMILKEFVAIYKHLSKDISVEKGRLMVDRKRLEILLDQHNYLPAHEKLRIYKQLNFILSEGGGLTKTVYDKETGKTKRKIIFLQDTYKTVEYLLSFESKV